jgi:hypothetical protein
MSMRSQVAEVGTYKIFIYKNNEGLWEFWIKQRGRLLVKSTGTRDCNETKALIQKHLHASIMTKTEKEHFDPTETLKWKNDLVSAQGNAEVAG